MEKDPPTDPGGRFAAAVKARTIARQVAARHDDLGRWVPYRAAALGVAWIGAFLAPHLDVSDAVLGGLLALTGAFLGADTLRPSGKRKAS